MLPTLDGVERLHPAKASSMAAAMPRLHNLVLIERMRMLSFNKLSCGPTPPHKWYYTPFGRTLQVLPGRAILLENEQRSSAMMLLREQLEALPPGGWTPFLESECSKPYFAALDEFVNRGRRPHDRLPCGRNRFLPLSGPAPAERTRVVILGQGPLPRTRPGHGAGLLGARRLQGPAQPEKHLQGTGSGVSVRPARPAPT